MKKLIGFWVPVGFVLSALMATSVFAAKDDIVFDASMGKVTFTHK